MELNFVFLRGKMYDCTSTSQKTKNAKTALDSMSKAVLQSFCQRKIAATFFYKKEALLGLFYFIWRGSDHFIDSQSGGHAPSR